MSSSVVDSGRSAAHRWVGRIVVVVTVAVSLWSMTIPVPYVAATCAVAAVPIVALALLWAGRGRFALEGHQNDQRPSVAVAFVLPAIVLWTRSLDLTLLDGGPPLLWAAALALPLSLLACASDPALRRSWLVLPVLAIVLGAWAWGAIRFANALLDGAEGEAYEARVLEKRYVGAKGANHRLTLGAWGPRAAGGEVTVLPPVHAAVQVGDRVCPTIQPGALGVRWLRIERCGP